MAEKTIYNYKEIKTILDEQISKSGVIVMPKEINKNNTLPNYKAINEYYKKTYNSTYVKYYSDKGFKVKEGNYSYDEILEGIGKFVKIHNKFPKTHEFKSVNGLPAYGYTVKVLKDNGETLNDVATRFDIGRHLKTEGYDYWLQKLKDLGKEIGFKNITHNNISEYNLPSIKWFLQECPNDNVKNFNDFKRYELEYFDNLNLTKDEVTRRIYLMQSKLNRPLMYDDFRSPEDSTVGITIIIKFWGTMNKMKSELGLEVNQEDMLSKEKSKEEMLDDLEKLIKVNNRLPSSKEINACDFTNCCASYYKYFGGINEAFLTLGYKPNKKSISIHLTNDEIKSMYKDYIEDNGVVISYELAKKIYSLPSPTTVTRRFKCSWNEFIISLGFEPNKGVATETIANDGTLCLSIGESIVHNYLLRKKGVTNIKKEVFYKDVLRDKVLIKNSGEKRLDWTFEYNNEIYLVEYFGMMTVPTYVRRHDIKLDLIKKDNKLDRFISVYPQNINDLDKYFDKVLHNSTQRKELV